MPNPDQALVVRAREMLADLGDEFREIVMKALEDADQTSNSFAWITQQAAGSFCKALIPVERAIVAALAAGEGGGEAALIEALTPSAETKAAYIGEFSFNVMDRDDDDHEVPRRVLVPWDQIKEIMAAIRERALATTQAPS